MGSPLRYLQGLHDRAQRELAKRRRPAEIVGICAGCGENVDRAREAHDGVELVHVACFAKRNDERAWRAIRRAIMEELSSPLARALGRPQVEPLIEELDAPRLLFSRAFTILATLESLIRAAPVADPRAVSALANARDMLRTYLHSR